MRSLGLGPLQAARLDSSVGSIWGKSAFELPGFGTPPDNGWQDSGDDLKIRLWSMTAPSDAEPLELLRGDIQAVQRPRFQPAGELVGDRR